VGRLVERRDDDGYRWRRGNEDVFGMRLGVFTGDRYWRQGETVSSDVAFVHFLAGLAERVSELVVFGRLDPRPGVQANVLDTSRLRFVALPHYDRLTDLRALLRAWRVTGRRFSAEIDRCDAVWIFGPHPLVQMLVWSAERAGVPVFLGARMDFPRYVSNRLRGTARLWGLPAGHALDLTFRRLARSRPTVVVGSELAEHYGGRQTLVSGVSLIREVELASEEKADAEWGETIRVLTVTRLEAEKNPLLLPEILIRLRPEGDWRLQVIGDGPLRHALEQRAAALRLGSALELTGYVPFGEELRGHYWRADVFLHVSLTEGLPQVLYEAAAAGLPIVATDVGGVARALREGEWGIVVPPRDGDAAARALLSLRDPQLRARLVRAGLAYAREHTLERQVREILRFFDACLKRRAAHGIDPAVRRRSAQ
jgi:glycosyltransferase involved in cell wall biosynthesis